MPGPSNYAIGITERDNRAEPKVSEDEERPAKPALGSLALCALVPVSA
jgi:hypothetical protein